MLISNGYLPMKCKFPSSLWEQCCTCFVFYTIYFNLFSILMTSQLSFSTSVLHLASLRINVSTAKEQNMGKPS